MARIQVTVEEVSPVGLDPTDTAGIVDGHMFDNDGKSQVRVRNANIAAQNVTFVTPKTEGGAANLAVADNVQSVPASASGGAEGLLFGPFAPDIYNQSDGRVWIDYAGTAADFSIEVTRLPLG